VTEPILAVERLCKQFASRNGDIHALEDISFSVIMGEFVCIVGPSGCGKTTLLRILAGLIEPDQGQVCLHEQPLRGPQSKIGVVFQKPNLMPWRTVFDNVTLPLQIRRLPAEEAKARVTAVLKMVGLLDFATAYPRELSGGMQQRVAIARALVYDPEILLLDEPFGALDALTREHLNHELLQLWQASGKTVIMVTHNIREAVFLSGRVVVLTKRPGRVADIIPSPLPRPRPESLFYDSEFSALAYKVRQAIR
jgi:NitT/TauT family transport system ATP-binding protein